MILPSVLSEASSLEAKREIVVEEGKEEMTENKKNTEMIETKGEGIQVRKMNYRKLKGK